MNQTVRPELSKTVLSVQEIGKEGEGVANHENKRIFLPFALPGDVVEAKLPKLKKKFFSTVNYEFIEQKHRRSKNTCKHYYNCGGCRMQHFEPEDYSHFKQDKFERAVKRAGYEIEFLPVIEVGPKSRRRATFHFNAKEGTIGFYKMETYSVVDMQECFLLTPEFFALVSPLREVLKEMQSPPYQAFVTMADTGADILVYGFLPPTVKDTETLSSFAEKHDAARLAWKQKANLIPIVARKEVAMRFGKVMVTLPEESFLQPSSKGQEILVNEVIKGLEETKHAVDLFCGCGTYTFPLAEHMKVHGAEIGVGMINSLNKAVAENGLSGRVTVEKRNLFHKPLDAEELNKFDGAVINPPRSGALEQSEKLAQSNIRRIVMVSCNPDSFSRDAKILNEGGYKLKRAVGIDQFYRSPHLEIVGVFTK